MWIQATPILSLATPLHFTCVQHVSGVREHPKPPQLHPSNPELSLLQRRFIIGLYLCFHSCGHYPEIRLSWSVHTHSFLLMKPLKPPKLGTRPFSDLERPDNHGVTSSSRLLTVWASPEESWGPWPDTHSGPHHHCLHQYGDGLDAVPYCSLFSLCCAGNSCRTHTSLAAINSSLAKRITYICVFSAYCEVPEDDKIISSENKDKFLDGEVFYYQCALQADHFSATCVDGKWKTKVECVGKSIKMGPENCLPVLFLL